MALTEGHGRKVHQGRLVGVSFSPSTQSKTAVRASAQRSAGFAFAEVADAKHVVRNLPRAAGRPLRCVLLNTRHEKKLTHAA